MSAFSRLSNVGQKKVSKDTTCPAFELQTYVKIIIFSELSAEVLISMQSYCLIKIMKIIVELLKFPTLSFTWKIFALALNKQIIS